MPFGFAMARLGTTGEEAAVESYRLLKDWGSLQLRVDENLCNGRDDLFARCRHGSIVAFGRPEPSKPHQKIEPIEFRSLVLSSHGGNGWLYRLDGTPAYSDVLVDAKSFAEALSNVSTAAIPPPSVAVEANAPPSAATDTPRSTIAAENRALRTLVELMREKPLNPVPKRVLLKMLKISRRALDRIFSRAAREANAPAWSTAGRRRKGSGQELIQSPHL